MLKGLFLNLFVKKKIIPSLRGLTAGGFLSISSPAAKTRRILVVRDFHGNLVSLSLWFF